MPRLCKCGEHSKSSTWVVVSLVVLLVSIVVFYEFERLESLYFSGDRSLEFVEIDDSLAKQIKDEVRLVCWVMTHPANHETRAIAVKETWGKRCNTLLFMSTAEDPVLNTIVLPVEDGREHLWDKVKLAFSYIYENHLNETDWVLKADDDTYVVVENLRYMLKTYSPEEASIFGCKFRTTGSKDLFMSGGAGYVLSRKAMVEFVENGIYKNECTDGFYGVEDVAIGICMRNLNVTIGNSLDEVGHQRFFPFGPDLHLIPNFYDEDVWYWEYRVDGTPDVRIDNCSTHVISFHYISPVQMKVFDYFLYEVNVYGRTRKSRPLRIE